MKTFRYEIQTTAGSASGTLQAETESAARTALTKQYRGYVDGAPIDEEKGEFEKTPIEVSDLTLTEVAG